MVTIKYLFPCSAPASTSTGPPKKHTGLWITQMVYSVLCNIQSCALVTKAIQWVSYKNTSHIKKTFWRREKNLQEKYCSQEASWKNTTLWQTLQATLSTAMLPPLHQLLLNTGWKKMASKRGHKRHHCLSSPCAAVSVIKETNWLKKQQHYRESCGNSIPTAHGYGYISDSTGNKEWNG